MGRVLLTVALVALAAAGCGGSSTVTVTTTETVTVTTPSGETAGKVYFMRHGKVGPVARDLESTSTAALLAAQAEGPTEAERAIGFDPGEANERLAATVFTLSQFTPDEPVTTGSKPYHRSDFEELTPAILVESPLPFATVSSPLHVEGTANTFEATFEYDLVDASGKVLAHDFVTATSGSGTRGTYSFEVPFDATGPAKLVVYEISAADGSRRNVVEIPLKLSS